jgi:hypothetical protein
MELRNLGTWRLQMTNEQTESLTWFESAEKLVWQDIKEVMADMLTMPERTLALVSAAQLDEQLTELLRACLKSLRGLCRMEI